MREVLGAGRGARWRPDMQAAGWAVRKLSRLEGPAVQAFRRLLDVGSGGQDAARGRKVTRSRTGSIRGLVWETRSRAVDIVVRRCSELDARNQAPNASAGGGWSKGLLSVKLPKPRRSRGQGAEGPWED